MVKTACSIPLLFWRAPNLQKQGFRRINAYISSLRDYWHKEELNDARLHVADCDAPETKKAAYKTCSSSQPLSRLQCLSITITEGTTSHAYAWRLYRTARIEQLLNLYNYINVIYCSILLNIHIIMVTTWLQKERGTRGCICGIYMHPRTLYAHIYMHAWKMAMYETNRGAPNTCMLP